MTAPRASAGAMRAGGAAVLFALATVVLTWPLFRHPATTVLSAASVYTPPSSLLVQSDLNLTLWVLAWDTHALVTHPFRLFDANAFYPAPSTLACSEHMLGNVPLFAPVYLATHNPVLAHQATLVASFVLAGLAMAAYVLYWSGDRPSALAAGFLYAFAPFRFWQLGNLHVISTQYLPLVALGIDATLDRGGWRWPVALAGALVLSSLCSYYIGYAAFFLGGLYLVAGVVARGRRSVAHLPSAVLALVVAMAAAAAVSIPYLLLQRRHLIPHYETLGFANIGFVGMLRFGVGGLLRNYLVPGRDTFPHFLTYTALALAMVGLFRHRRHPRAALVAVAVGGIVLALGPVLFTPWGVVPLPYLLFAQIVPGFSAMRVPYRFGTLTSLGVVALAGLGLAATRRLLRDGGRARLAAVLPVLVIATGLAESTPHGPRPAPMAVGDAVPPAYRWLAAHGDGGPLLELPTRQGGPVRESLAMYYSTFHWLPLVNGYTAYPPRPYLEIMKAAHHLPAPEALSAILERVRLRWILVHRDAISQARWPDWELTLHGAFRSGREFGPDLLFEVTRGADSATRRRASSERLATDSVAVPAKEPIDRMDTEHGDVPHEDAVDGGEGVRDRLIHLRHAEGNPKEPDAAGLALLPAARPQARQTIGRYGCGRRDLQRRDVDRAPERTCESEGDREDGRPLHRASPSAT